MSVLSQTERIVTEVRLLPEHPEEGGLDAFHVRVIRLGDGTIQRVGIDESSVDIHQQDGFFYIAGRDAMAIVDYLTGADRLREVKP